MEIAFEGLLWPEEFELMVKRRSLSDWVRLLSPVVTAMMAQGLLIWFTSLIFNRPVVSYLDVPAPMITKQMIASQRQPSWEELERWFEKYAQEYGVNGRMLVHLARCESGFNPLAESSTGKYAGLYQFDVRTWQANRKRMGLADDAALRFDAEEAIRTAAFVIKHRGSSAWPYCGRSFFNRV